MAFAPSLHIPDLMQVHGSSIRQTTKKAVWTIEVGGLHGAIDARGLLSPGVDICFTKRIYTSNGLAQYAVGHGFHESTKPFDWFENTNAKGSSSECRKLAFLQ
jgi:hypothetical protein